MLTVIVTTLLLFQRGRAQPAQPPTSQLLTKQWELSRIQQMVI